MPIGKKLVFLTDPGEEELEIELLCRVLFLIIDSTHRKMGSFGSHGHIIHFSTCRARVIRWPVGRIVQYIPTHMLPKPRLGGNSATAWVWIIRNYI